MLGFLSQFYFPLVFRTVDVSFKVLNLSRLDNKFMCFWCRSQSFHIIQWTWGSFFCFVFHRWLISFGNTNNWINLVETLYFKYYFCFYYSNLIFKSKIRLEKQEKKTTKFYVDIKYLHCLLQPKNRKINKNTVKVRLLNMMRGV